MVCDVSLGCWITPDDNTDSGDAAGGEASLGESLWRTQLRDRTRSPRTRHRLFRRT
jgi:hypothetical protein